LAGCILVILGIQSFDSRKGEIAMTTRSNTDSRLVALQASLAAKGASVPAVSTVEEITKQLGEARATLRLHCEQTAAEIKKIEDDAAQAAEPVKTLIVELERKLREAKKSDKSGRLKLTGSNKTGNRTFGGRSH